jgi:hypothetical protein
MNTSNYWRRRGREMRQKVRLGLILAVALSAILWQMPQTGQVKMPDDLVITPRHATWEEKRENRKIARHYAEAGWGWRGREWECLRKLWTRESRFDHLAQNPDSSAFGIAQRLRERSPRAELQILRGLRYIAHRYGTPCKSWAFHQRHNYY